MAENVIYKPKEEYQFLETQFKEDTEQYFNKLTEEGAVDKEANALHVKDYKTQLNKIALINKRLNGARTAKGFAIAGIIISLIAAVFLIFAPLFNDVLKLWFLFLIAGALIGVAIFLIIFIKKKISTKIDRINKELDAANKEGDRLHNICYEDLKGLNSLFDYGMAAKIMNKVTPIIQIDKTFNNDRVVDLVKNFGFPTYKNDNETVLGVTSGHVQGNPFALVKSRIRTMGTKTYHGTLVITWTTYSYDSKGNRVAHHHTQTLHAYLTKPCPYYTTITKLHFGSEVSPKLSFSRSPTHGDVMSEKEQEKYVKKGSKAIQKKAEDAIKNGKTFTPLGNDKFEVFFNALNRNNEVDFRLMFTALAQQNMLSLILDKNPYGDDFTFVKKETLNTIIAKHNQSFNFNISPDKFLGYDYEVMKQYFINYCMEYCRSLYFSFAPILSIPMYQMHKPHDFIYKDEENTNISYVEQEIMANALGEDYFRPKDASSDVPVMIKYDSSRRSGKGDFVHLTSQSYEKIPHVDFIPKLGGDGFMHSVPVHWIEYREVKDEKDMAITTIDASLLEFKAKEQTLINNSNINNAYHFERGLFSFGIKGNYTSNMDEGITSLFKKGNE